MASESDAAVVREALTDERLAEIRALVNAATPARWGYADEHGLMDGAEPAWCVSRMDGDRWLFDIAYVESYNQEADAAFIASARTDVPDLLAEVDRLRALLAAVDDRCVMSPTCVFGTRDE